jgi:uroporphyrinogen decarboxylase
MNVDMANIDYCVDLGRAMEHLPRTCIDGTVKSLSFVQESPATISRSCTELIRTFSTRGGFVLSSGCEIPLEAEPRTIDAMVAAAGAART